MERLVKATTGHPIITILIVLGITVLALIPASNFAVDTDVESWFGENDLDITMAQDVKELFGAQNMVTVVVDCTNSDAATAEAYIDRV